MTFDKSKFRNGGNGTDSSAIHTYKTADTIATINTAAYFNDLVNEVAVGDLIYGYTNSDSTAAAYLFYVNANDGTAVDVTDGTLITGADTD